MSTFQDIKTRFEVALLKESRKKDYSQDATKEVRDILLKNKIRGNKKQDLFELRFGISGDPKSTQDWLINNVLSGIDTGNYTITYESPDRAKKGDAKSGTYYTHKITVINSFKIGSYDAQEGDAVFIIDNLKAKSNIQNKMLAPDGLGLSDKTYNNLASLRSDVDLALTSHVTNETISEPHYDFMMDLLDGIINGVKTSFGDITDVKAGHTETIFFNSNGAEEHISDPDIAKIAKDFGEVLGGAYLFNLTGGGTLGLYFPKDSNEPLVDFQIDGQSISMKAGEGAAPSLSNIGALIAKDPQKWIALMSTDEQKLMLSVVKTFHENEAALGVFKVAELINAPGFELFKTLIDVPNLKAADIDKNILSELVISMFKQDADSAYDKFNTYFNALGKFPDGWNNKEQQIEDAIARKDAFGLIMSPLAYHIKDILNNNTLLIEALTEVIQKFDILQLYIDLKLNKTKQYQKYTLKKFAEGKFLFNATPSVNLPTRNKFGFKMVKK